MGQQPSSSWNEGNRHIPATGQWAYLPAQCRCQLQPALWTTNRHILSQLPKPQPAISSRNDAWRRTYSIHKQQAGNRQMAFHSRPIPLIEEGLGAVVWYEIPKQQQQKLPSHDQQGWSRHSRCNQPGEYRRKNLEFLWRHKQTDKRANQLGSLWRSGAVPFSTMEQMAYLSHT